MTPTRREAYTYRDPLLVSACFGGYPSVIAPAEAASLSLVSAKRRSGSFVPPHLEHGLRRGKISIASVASPLSYFSLCPSCPSSPAWHAVSFPAWPSPSPSLPVFSR